MKRVRTPKIPGAAQITVATLPAPRAVTSACVLKLFGAEQDQELLLSLTPFLPIHPLPI